MKILVLTGNYPNRQALNNGIFVHQQVKALQQLGVECYVMLLHNWYPPFGLHRYHAYWREGFAMRSSFFEEYEGVKIYPVPMFVKMPARIFKESYYQRAERAIIRIVKRVKALQGASWLYAHFLTDNGYIGARIRDSLGLKLAAIARGDDIHAWPEANPALRKNLAFVFEKADLLLANSRNLGIDARKWMLPGREREVLTVYNGIDYARYRPAQTPEERRQVSVKFGLSDTIRYLVCVGTPVALKGWYELLDAIQAMAGKLTGWKLLMVAPKRANPDAIDLQNACNERGIADLTRFMGELAPADLAVLFRACDVFVLPSYNEGMANALLEAMATGLACIATEVGGHNEVVEHGKNGILVAPRSTAALVQAIELVTSNEELRKKMGAHARERMIRFGDYAENAGRLLELLEQRSRNAG